jgi:hypothetical protein
VVSARSLKLSAVREAQEEFDATGASSQAEGVAELLIAVLSEDEGSHRCPGVCRNLLLCGRNRLSGVPPPTGSPGAHTSADITPGSRARIP